MRPPTFWEATVVEFNSTGDATYHRLRGSGRNEDAARLDLAETLESMNEGNGDAYLLASLFWRPV